MDRNSNSYTLIYVAAMVIIVAFILAFTAEALKERKDRNIEIDKKRQILSSLNIDATSLNAEELYDQYIRKAVAINYRGEEIEGIDALSIATETEIKNPEESRLLPLYIAEKDGKTYYVLSLSGSGFFGPVWGYISLKSDKNTVYGAYFSHKGETPGLGAEITKNDFKNRFCGKEIFKNGLFKSIAIVKSGISVKDRDFVNGVTGATVTSQGVAQMLLNSLEAYMGFLTEK
ncbi:MAG: NADH:ubiquinone reductase (Na(+)-transporting) subunit C [Prevotellaceae bacterium]|jgi:Na+-transporting NADH:ubiquinone oxidoreductase subunit C|nr:NADH:ubiquinone reductase (Na(+)-transporting) subunit C [Prevotellaceae bacterium]